MILYLAITIGMGVYLYKLLSNRIAPLPQLDTIDSISN